MNAVIFGVLTSVLLSTSALSQTVPTAAPTPSVSVQDPYGPAALADRVSANTRPFAIDGGVLAGPGADFLRDQTARAQFVLLGESHFDRDTPIFALGLYRMLQVDHGFDRLVVENDPLAMDAVNAAAGDLDQVVALARRYPLHIGFASDPDLRLYTEVARGSRPGAPAVWGVEQAQGAVRYLEELLALAPTANLRSQTAALLEEARAKDTLTGGLGFSHDDPTVSDRLTALRTGWAPSAGSRADWLLSYLHQSTVIYGYNRRAGAGEAVGLFNNTAREQLFKENFIRMYRADSVNGRTPKVMFKMGGWHIYRGMSPGRAFTIGNFAHEFAIANGREAYGINVAPVEQEATDLSHFPVWMQPILPVTVPTGPVVIDLRALQPYSRRYAALLPEGERDSLISFISSHDALVLLPNSVPASFDLTGFPPR